MNPVPSTQTTMAGPLLPVLKDLRLWGCSSVSTAGLSALLLASPAQPKASTHSSVGVLLEGLESLNVNWCSAVDSLPLTEVTALPLLRSFRCSKCERLPIETLIELFSRAPSLQEVCLREPLQVTHASHAKGQHRLTFFPLLFRLCGG